MGALKSKVDEQSLITYLEQMNEGDKPTTTIKVVYYFILSSKGRSTKTMISIFNFIITQTTKFQ